jgi:hypothetical protein
MGVGVDMFPLEVGVAVPPVGVSVPCAGCVLVGPDPPGAGDEPRCFPVVVPPGRGVPAIVAVLDAAVVLTWDVPLVPPEKVDVRAVLPAGPARWVAKTPTVEATRSATVTMPMANRRCVLKASLSLPKVLLLASRDATAPCLPSGDVASPTWDHHSWMRSRTASRIATMVQA